MIKSFYMQALTQRQIQFITSLKQTKFRRKHHQFVIEGDKLCHETLLHPGVKIHMVCAKANWLNKNKSLLENQKVFEISDKVLKKISSFKTPNQVLMVLEQFDTKDTENSFNKKLCFYLDHIQDPGNMGTIIRCCEWFGIRPLYISPDCVDIYNPKVVQASMGALLHVPIIPRSFNEILDRKGQDTIIFVAGMDGHPIKEVKIPSAGLIVIGNEGGGVREIVLRGAGQVITIPKDPNSKAESLNASVAAGILAHWIAG